MQHTDYQKRHGVLRKIVKRDVTPVRNSCRGAARFEIELGCGHIKRGKGSDIPLTQARCLECIERGSK